MLAEPEISSPIAGTVVTAAEILEFIAERGKVLPQDLSKELDLNRSTVHRMLHTLQLLNYVGRMPDGTYRLTFHLFELGNSVPHSHNLIDSARRELLQLSYETGYTVNHAVLYEDQVLYIDKAAPASYLQLDLAVGESEPAHCTSLGKVLIAFQTPSVAETILRRIVLPPFTPNTITDRDVLRREIDVVRNQGYALDNQELAMELRCIAAPVLRADKTLVSAVSISGPSDRLRPEHIPGLLPRLRDVVGVIGRNIDLA